MVRPGAAQGTHCPSNLLLTVVTNLVVRRVAFSEDQINRAATSLIAEYGERAEQEVKKRMATAKDRNLQVTFSEWGRILKAVEQLSQGGENRGGT